MIDIKKFRVDNDIRQSEICEVLSIAQPYLSAIESGRRPLNKDKFQQLYKHYGNIILNYKKADIVIGEETIKHERKKIPFYDDIATIGGTNELSSDTDNGNARVAEWIDAGDWFPEATSAIRHYGSSMIEYPSGSILALKRVNDRRLIINGRNYVVETTEFRITKQLQDDGGDYIMAYSSNRETYPDGRQIHSPVRIPKDTIRHIDIVLGCVQKEYSNGAIPIKK